MNTEIIQAAPSNSLAVMPVVDVRAALARYQAEKEFIAGVLRQDVDFGVIPGTAKNTLLKPGAEKLSFFFGLRPQFSDVQTIEDWTGQDHNGEPFFYYRVRCELYRDGQIIASADGSCNSWEKKYRYRWVSELDIPAHLDKSKLRTKGGRTSEFSFAIEKGETTGKYGKPAEYWKRFRDAIANGTATPTKRKTKNGGEMDAWEIDDTLYCIPNDDMAEQVNTILKMAQKRALIAAVLIGANASEWFTQDIEDFTDAEYQPAPQVRVTRPPESEPEPPHEPDMESPASTPATGMAYETAKTMTNGDGIPLGDLDTKKLQFMLTSLNKALTKPGLTQEERDDKESEKAAIVTILNARFTHK